ncbi:ankyrin repeat domain-containing protein [Gynuella sunshinyii]|uniref:Ankyrin repeat n=1 Tax=Gynuella sunshinyii YC6258 TaxID=1445510 RepID=A0A0C5VSL4_9GAMM|nr:ankyrin repeat domain-containing protein [Gynuella sunshinyii]AJQ93249.1 ankyrin repeat [Gynuella sunshinyii YC6258]
MNNLVRELLDKIESVPDFMGFKLSDINDTNGFGDNALHCVCVWGDIEAVKLLVENGIDIEQQGEGGFTPLKVADEFEHEEIVKYLISKGANTEALNANFQYDPELSARHIERLRDIIEDLEQGIDSECGKK